MYPFRKPQNRRLGHSQMLEVKRLTDSARTARWRLVWQALGAAACALVALYGVEHAWQYFHEEVFTHSEALALNTIEIDAGAWVTAPQVRAQAGARLGANTLLLDLEGIKRDLELLPQIEAVSVERVPPHLLRIKVAERRPRAQVRAVRAAGPGAWEPLVYYLDGAGVVMPPLPNWSPPGALAGNLEALPVLRGFNTAQLRPGQAVGDAAVHAALRLLREFAQSPMAGQAVVASVDVSWPEVLLLTTRTGVQITFAQDDFAVQLARWRLVQAAGQSLGKTLVSLDLSLPNNCPVHWFETNAPPPGIKAGKPSPNLRQNV